jgi:hypothetical protein
MRFAQTLMFMLVLSFAIFGQTNKGGISGTVTDATGAVIPGATVTVVNTGTKETTTITTSDEGTFSIRSLDPVTYRITVEAANFKKSIVESVKVDTASVATINVKLEAGSIGEQVTIEASAPLINTESGTTGQTVTEREIQDIPLSNRSVLDLAATVANVSGDAGSEDPDVTSGQPVPGFNLSINGGRPGSTAILADGVNNTGVGIARAVVSFTPETVQEFTVQTSAYSAEFGQTGGGVINATTKSGTNLFNGTALVYHRNPATNAKPYREGTGPRPENFRRYTQVSVSAGGPVFLPSFGEGGKPFYDGRNRTFFFIAYEPRWLRDFLQQAALLPTAAERTGNFNNLVRTSNGWLPTEVATQFGLTSVGQANIYQQFTRNAAGQFTPIVLPANSGGNTFQFCQFGYPSNGPNRFVINGVPQNYCFSRTNLPFTPNPALNIIPTEFLDPTAQRLLEFMPLGGTYFLDDAGEVKNYLVNRFVRQDETRWTVRLDHNITTNNKATFRFSKTPGVGIRGFGSEINGNTAAYSDAVQYLFSDNHIFSPTVVNDFRFNYTRGVFSEDFSPEFSIFGGRNLATELSLPSLTEGGIPSFAISGDSNNGYSALSNIGAGGSTNNFNKEERFNINDIVYWNRGNMTWKFGFDASHARLQVTPFFRALGGYDFRVAQTSNTRQSGTANGGNPVASLLLGVPNVVNIRPLLIEYNYRWDSYAGFVQNDWKVRPNLTLNLGLRYSLQLPRYEKDNLQGVFLPELAQTITLTEAQRRQMASGTNGFGIPANSPIPSYIPTTVTIPPFAFAGRGGRSKYITPIDWNGFEPRFGFAWSPKFWSVAERMNMVIRGGYGLSHSALTGNNRNPNPDFSGATAVTSTATGSSGTANSGQPVQLTTNQPLFNALPLEQSLGVTQDGLVYLNAINLAATAFVQTPDNGKVPSTQNWNLSLAFEPFKNTVVEFAYVGSKGTHLYLPLINTNPRDVDFIEQIEAAGINADTAFSDPLGRTNLLGSVITIPRGSVASPYFGYGNLNRYFDPSGNSIRHAGYIDVRRRVRGGLTFTANYTFAKSIDDASDASPDTRVLNTASTQGQVSYGATRGSDRAISTFDIKHNFNSTFVYDLPFGKGRQFLSNASGFVNTLLGNWTVSGVFRLQGGVPFVPFITDTNRLGGGNRIVRPDLVAGVPLLNPLYSEDCRLGSLCEPYINPAAFKRPAKGSLGNAPRTLDVRAPMQRYFDFSIQKDFKWPFADNDGKRRIQFRVDLLNAFNHPNFRLSNTGSGTAGFTTNIPTETNFTTAEITAYNAATGRNVTADQVNALLIQSRVNNILPLDFFSIPVPPGFASTTPNSFDITTLEGLKLYRLRQVYDNNFGTLREVNSPRYIQFGIKVYF